MKNDTATIRSSWRNFKVPDKQTYEKDNKEVLLERPAHLERNNSSNNSNIKPINPSVSKVENKRTKGAIMPPSASKFHHNQKLIDTKFKKQSKSQSFDSNILYGDGSSSDWQIMEEILSNKDQKLMGNFMNHIDMARNLNPSKGRKIQIDYSGNRKLSADFCRIISKIAEDNSGNIIDGNDRWDMDKLIYRAVDNRNILKCKSSRELESVILLLDSSPSCESYAKLYSSLASISSNYGDIDMYNAPNARITHRYDARKKEFLKCMNLDDLKMNAHRWAYFKNRVILFFGDCDGIRVVLENTFRNKVYWFATDSEERMNYDIKNYAYNKDKLTIFPNITNAKNFIKAMKMIK